MTKIWNSEDAHEMGTLISNSNMHLQDTEKKLITRALDPDPSYNFSVYELYDLNVLCYMVRGFLRKEKTNE